MAGQPRGRDPAPGEPGSPFLGESAKAECPGEEPLLGESLLPEGLCSPSRGEMWGWGFDKDPAHPLQHHKMSKFD